MTLSYFIMDVTHGCCGVSNHRQLNCLFNNLFRQTTKKLWKDPRCQPVFLSEIHWGTVHFTHKALVIWKAFPYHYVILSTNVDMFLGYKFSSSTGIILGMGCALKTTLHYNVVSHWLNPYPKWSLISDFECRLVLTAEARFIKMVDAIL